jgi:hypothetical protein
MTKRILHEEFSMKILDFGGLIGCGESNAESLIAIPHGAFTIPNSVDL